MKRVKNTKKRTFRENQERGTTSKSGKYKSCERNNRGEIKTKHCGGTRPLESKLRV